MLGQVNFVQSAFAEVKRIIGDRRAVLLIAREVSKTISLSARLLQSELKIDVIELDDGEKQKDWSNVISTIDRLAEIDFPRDGILIGVGGGATTDLAGFVASLWMRGVDWVAVPTTLAGMVDAAIGGKTAINTATGKNLVGAFHQPVATVIEQSFLATLPERDFNAGMAEVIKCGFISDPMILEIAESLNDDDLRDRSQSEKVLSLVQRSVAVKTSIVGRDFREGSVRAFLNYGHTLGHAIEYGSGYQLRHGEAISIGMHFAARISARIGQLTEDEVARHLDILGKFHLPLSFEASDFKQLWKTILRDKKTKSERVRFVVLHGLGDPELIDDLPHGIAEDVFLEYISKNQAG